jgi:tRNA (guanine10-N2)-dimethyltransferase
MQVHAIRNESARLARLFFILSGEHSSLPASEVLAILDSENITYSQVEKNYRLLRLNASSKALDFVAQRSLMYDKCGYLFAECAAEEKEIHQLLRHLPLEEYAANSESFAVRSERLGGVMKEIARTSIEREVGSLIKNNVPRLTVRLSKPDITFLCILYENSLLFGIITHAKPPGPISLRRPRKRPVFHPSTMPPKIARCMVNLSRAHPGKPFADPFCGVGGIIIEAALVGCDVLAIDASDRMLRGVRRNVKHFGLDSMGMLIGDARMMPFHGLDAVATDPPYGRDSSTRGLNVNDLMKDFLAGAKSCLKRGAHICISAPSEINLESYALDAGLELRERHAARIHRSLTRQFVVARNP